MVGDHLLSPQGWVSSGNRMCLRERQCVFGRDNVSSGKTMCLPGTRRPSQKLTSRSSLDVFPASIRTKMMREIHWSCQNCPEYVKNHENQPPIVFHFVFQNKCQNLRRCKIENYTILRVQTQGLPKSGGAGEGHHRKGSPVHRSLR